MPTRTRADVDEVSGPTARTGGTTVDARRRSPTGRPRPVAASTEAPAPSDR